MIRKIEPKSDAVDEDISVVKSKREPKKIYPRLRLEHSFFPEIKKWEVGKEYTVTLKLRMTGISISRFQNDSEFDIIGIDDKSKK